MWEKNPEKRHLLYFCPVYLIRKFLNTHMTLEYFSVSIFNAYSATGTACQQRTLTPPDTWSCPTFGLASVLMLRPISPELVLFLDLGFRTSLGTSVLICLNQRCNNIKDSFEVLTFLYCCRHLVRLAEHTINKYWQHNTSHYTCLEPYFKITKKKLLLFVILS